MTDKKPLYSLQGIGYRTRASGINENMEYVQIFHYEGGFFSGSFICRIPESSGNWWLFENGSLIDGIIKFDMVHGMLRYTRIPVAHFCGKYDGEGVYSGMWTSEYEEGIWQLSFREEI